MRAALKERRHLAYCTGLTQLAYLLAAWDTLCLSRSTCAVIPERGSASGSEIENAVSDNLDDIAALEVVATELEGESSSIPSNDIDIRVVKCWYQAEYRMFIFEYKHLTPELLLKDDRESLVDGYKRKSKGWRAGFRFANYYQPPEVRLSGQACTSLAAGQAK